MYIGAIGAARKIDPVQVLQLSTDVKLKAVSISSIRLELSKRLNDLNDFNESGWQRWLMCQNDRAENGG